MICFRVSPGFVFHSIYSTSCLSSNSSPIFTNQMNQISYYGTPTMDNSDHLEDLGYNHLPREQIWIMRHQQRFPSLWHWVFQLLLLFLSISLLVQAYRRIPTEPHCSMALSENRTSRLQTSNAVKVIGLSSSSRLTRI